MTLDSTISALMVSTSYPANLNDWRALFIRHLCDAMGRRSDLALKLWAPPGELHPNISNATTSSESAWLKTLMDRGGIAHLIRHGGIRRLTAPLRLLNLLRITYSRNRGASLYHINWLQNALSLPNNKKPILISVLGSDLQLLKLPMMKPLLRQIFRQHQTIICPNAEWMIEPLHEAFGKVAQIQLVVFGVDSKWFKIERKIENTKPPIWLVVSRLTKAKLGPIFEWSEPEFKNNFRELHLFGPMQEQIELPAWVHYHGPATPEQLQKEWFPRAHGLISLSEHAEGRPQVMLEAMAAGLPILASKLPAHENIVFNGNTGWICNSSTDLSNRLKELEPIDRNRAFGLNSKTWTQTNIGSWDDCAARYVSIYKRLLE